MTPTNDIAEALRFVAGGEGKFRGVELDASESALKAIISARLSGVATVAYLEGEPIAAVLPMEACRRLLDYAGLLVEGPDEGNRRSSDASTSVASNGGGETG